MISCFRRSLWRQVALVRYACSLRYVARQSEHFLRTVYARSPWAHLTASRRISTGTHIPPVQPGARLISETTRSFCVQAAMTSAALTQPRRAEIHHPFIRRQCKVSKLFVAGTPCLAQTTGFFGTAHTFGVNAFRIRVRRGRRAPPFKSLLSLAPPAQQRRSSTMLSASRCKLFAF